MLFCNQMVTSWRAETVCLAGLYPKGTSTGSPRDFGHQEDTKEGWRDTLWPAPALLSDVSHEPLLEFLASWTLLHYILKQQQQQDWRQESQTDTDSLVWLREPPSLQPAPHYVPKPWAKLRRRWEKSLNFKVVGSQVSAFSLAWSEESMNCSLNQ